MKKRIVIFLVLICLSFCLGFDFLGIHSDISWPENMKDTNDKLNADKFDIMSFPYYFEENKELLEYYGEVINGNADNYYFLSKAIYKPQYKKSIAEKDFLYFGKLKNDRPNGKGVLFQAMEDMNGLYYPIVIGDFKDGYVDGYALCYDVQVFGELSSYTLKGGYEGEYSKGRPEGIGIKYHIPSKEDKIIVANLYGVYMVTNASLFGGTVEYYGEVKDGEPNGEGCLYDYSGLISFEGTWKKGYKEEGKEYMYGNLVYEGEYRNGVYHGKGILYNEDGSIQHKGEFRYGDIK